MSAATVVVRRDDLELLIQRGLSRSGFNGSVAAEKRLALAAGRCRRALAAVSGGDETGGAS